MTFSGSVSFHLQSWILLLAVLQIILLSIIPLAYPLSFNFSSFDRNDDYIEYEGDAFPLDNTIKLTMNQTNNDYVNSSYARATYREPVHIWDKSAGTLIDFTTNFSFFVTSKDSNNSADGLVFFLAANRSLPSNSAGECLGIISPDNKFNSSANNNPFVAVEFDDFKNDWDPVFDHFGIDINSILSVVTDTWRAEATQTNARVRYDSRSKSLSVFVTYDDLPDSYYNISYVVDLRKYLPEWVVIGFSAATGTTSQIHTIRSWSFNSSLEIIDDGKINVTKPAETPTNIDVGSPPSRTKSIKIWVIIVVAVAVVIVFMLCVLGLIWFLCSRSRRNMEERPSSMSMNGKANTRELTGHDHRNDDASSINGSNAYGIVNSDERRKEDDDAASMNDKFGKKINRPKKFSFAELVEATENFAPKEIIGKGGFGIVYKGFLREEKLSVAIKKFNQGSEQGTKEYEAEVMIISQLKHRNLVELIGYYHDQEQKDFILVYKFMSNGSLHDHLFKHNIPSLTWKKRYSIALDLAHGLHYLHERAGMQYVVHRDIKSANVLLDLSFKALLGDFGLARLVDQGIDPLTTYIAGTKGYLAPECAIDHQKPSKASDVYSFGIVALEIGCGKRAIEQIQGGVRQLVNWVWKLYGKRKILEAADDRLSKVFDQKQMERLLVVGLWCAHPHKLSRPSIESALHVLISQEVALPDLPPDMPEHIDSGPQLSTVYESSSSYTTRIPIST